MGVTPIIVSYSELDAYKQCRLKHHLAFKERWDPPTTGSALALGRDWHLIMETHYRALQAGATDKARLDAVVELLTGFAAVDEGQANLLAWMYDGHVEAYGKDEQWEVVAVEDQRLIRLPTPSGRGSKFWLRMRADLVVRQIDVHPKMQKLWVVDHKSGRRLPTDKELDIDDQFGLYTWGMRTLGDDIFGQWYSAAKTYRTIEPQGVDERFMRKRLYRTPKELATVAVEAYLLAREAYAARTQSNEGDPPRSPDPDRCRWRCSYTEPCLFGRKAGATQMRTFLQTAGFTQVTEEEQLRQRGYTVPESSP